MKLFSVLWLWATGLTATALICNVDNIKKELIMGALLGAAWGITFICTLIFIRDGDTK